MRKTTLKFMSAFFAYAALAGPSLANAASPYAGQQEREIKALSVEEVQSYLAGKGMGLAKPAELNGYPGPAHVLSLADALSLSAQQRQQTQTLFNAMEARAKGLGRALIEKERQLDQAFADKSVTHASLEQMLAQIGALQAQLRQAHLDAHLAQVKVLTSEQISRYNRLRGYAAAAGASHGGHAGHVGHAH